MIFVAPQLNYEVIMCRVYTKNGVVVRQKAYIGDVFENTLLCDDGKIVYVN